MGSAGDNGGQLSGGWEAGTPFPRPDVGSAGLSGRPGQEA